MHVKANDFDIDDRILTIAPAAAWSMAKIAGNLFAIELFQLRTI